MPLLRFMAIVVCLAAPAISPAVAAPSADLWARWAAHDPNSAASIDHAPWGRFLDRHVRTAPDGVNRLIYGEAGDEGRRTLKAYIADLAALPISEYSRREQFPYWVNLYNALTVDVVLDHYPVATIMDIDISPGWFSNGPWGRKLVEIEGEALSLDDIEHRILRPIWKDPRIHFAVNCASIGCPNLMRDAFTADRMEAMLEAATRDYANHPRGAHVADGKLYLSTIFRWYGDDFGNEAGVVDFIRRYAELSLAAAIGGIDGFSDGGYDWALNDCATAKAQSSCKTNDLR
jgi:hypothetical protein